MASQMRKKTTSPVLGSGALHLSRLLFPLMWRFSGVTPLMAGRTAKDQNNNALRNEFPTGAREGGMESHDSEMMSLNPAAVGPSHENLSGTGSKSARIRGSQRQLGKSGLHSSQPEATALIFAFALLAAAREVRRKESLGLGRHGHKTYLDYASIMAQGFCPYIPRIPGLQHTTFSKLPTRALLRGIPIRLF
ncbi:predicted protein [Pyrenophora tritici-repentis Pt-1C-BFP]|uniref:Uncharacterized protein n=1 Tax=Pyrenophora tritici-repentis (strain Pt-1C-BFP) TaxID=426418 RepID=B2W3R6_PYRTR|nr:uncharacterized protein PTRG_05116 [Pyrenophora tritici-repentis Pt-1C-BFP]EDU48023.1 predicted protein [Pyrenophora tritici-repentis Pt-1C-BFP]